MSEKILLEMKNITKVFPGVKALDDVNLKVKEGSIHALVGENAFPRFVTANRKALSSSTRSSRWSPI